MKKVHLTSWTRPSCLALCRWGDPANSPTAKHLENMDKIIISIHFKCTATFTKKVIEIPKGQEPKVN